ncbi:DNA cytosine methyltransferase [Spiribacter onubensis]|uniref:DNA cytosine methyltransferase n=1 Tax=Spiribacter onubensis TaxID=3122420 RepID=A0ABV3S6U3_9GAMM
MKCYYNEFDPYCAEWLRNLIREGHLPPGDVDDRSITEVCADEIRDYDQWHFFAGLGGWGYAARLAGIGDKRGILTGSPPCQPFSSAGRRQGYADERHLAPVWINLVAALRPAWVFGEQVAAAIKKDDWLDDLLNALETEGYSTGAVVLPACGVGAPHIRQRLWVVARLVDSGDAGSQRHGRPEQKSVPQKRGETERHRSKTGAHSGLADSHCERHHRERLLLREAQAGRLPFKVLEDAWSGEFIGLGDAERRRPESRNQPEGRPETAWKRQCVGGLGDSSSIGQYRGVQDRSKQQPEVSGEGYECGGLADSERNRSDRKKETKTEQSGYRQNWRVSQRGDPAAEGKPSASQAETGWDDPDWLYCRDEKWRPVESGTFPLADGIPARVGRLRAYGNAIVPQAAAEVMVAAMDGSL